MIRIAAPPEDLSAPSLAAVEGGDALVVGASGGLGAAFVRRLRQQPGLRRVFAWSRSQIEGNFGGTDGRIRLRTGVDLEREETVVEAADELADADADLRLVINATGLLHASGDPEDRADGGDASADDGPAATASAGMTPERRLDEVDPRTLARAFAVNATGPMLVLREVLRFVPRRQRSLLVSLSARVGSIGDNRLGGWYAYRASKAALNQLHRSLSVELGRSHPEAVVLLLHPGTVDTGLSEPFQGNVADGKLFGADAVAARLLVLADSADGNDSGGFFAWDGESIPW